MNDRATGGPARRAANTFFTSDTHFGHANILRYSRRPFANVDEMDDQLVARWNAAVGDDDRVYHLGDFTLRARGAARAAFARLRGRIAVLGYPWHHDAGWLPRALGPCEYASASGHPVEIVPPMVVLTEEVAGREQVIVLCHYPLASWDRARHGAWHLHGHSHGAHRGRGAILDVGVDCHDYAPVALADLPALVEARAAADPEAPRALPRTAPPRARDRGASASSGRPGGSSASSMRRASSRWLSGLRASFGRSGASASPLPNWHSSCADAAFCRCHQFDGASVRYDRHELEP